MRENNKALWIIPDVGADYPRRLTILPAEDLLKFLAEYRNSKAFELSFKMQRIDFSEQSLRFSFNRVTHGLFLLHVSRIMNTCDVCECSLMVTLFYLINVAY